MPVSISAPSPSRSDIKIIASGTYLDNTADANYHDVANFTTPGDLGNGILVIEWALEPSAGAGNHYFGIDTAAGNSTKITVGNSVAIREGVFYLKKDYAGTHILYHFYEFNAGAALQETSGANSDFVLNATEVVYLKSKHATVGETNSIRWIAYIILDNVKWKK